MRSQPNLERTVSLPRWLPALLLGIGILIPFLVVLIVISQGREGNRGVAIQLLDESGQNLAVDLIPDRWSSPRMGWIMGTEDDPSTPLGIDGPESGDAYVRRMLAALATEGELLEVYGSTSAFLPSENWVARFDSLLLRTAAGRLDALHLLTVRDRRQDRVSPLLLRVRAGAQPFLRVDLSAIELERESPLPFLPWLRSKQEGFLLSLRLDPERDASAAMARYAAPGFVPAGL